nr:diadenylate cyclase [Dolosigranulum pigrum]
MQIDLSWEALLSLGTVSSLIDIVIVSFIIYQLIKIVRGTRINELLNGIFIVLSVKVISSVFNLHTTEYLIDFVIQWSALALIIIFQPELRRGLEHLGRGSVFAKKKKADPAHEMIEALKKSITYMSKRRIGALISIEMETGLDEYVGTGIRMNSEISSELVTNILFRIHHFMTGPLLSRISKFHRLQAICHCRRVQRFPKNSERDTERQLVCLK